MATTPASLVNDINSIYTPLLAGLTFDLNLPIELDGLDLVTTPPDVTISPVPDFEAPTLASLTEGDTTLTGSGAFDVIMRALNKHLELQFRSGNISATEKSKIYIEALGLALQQGAQYVVQSHAAAWAGETSKRQAESLELQKAILKQEHLSKIMETVTAKLSMQKMRIDAYTAQGQLVNVKVNVGQAYHTILQNEAQRLLLSEQVDSARAQTKETLTDGTPISGLLALEKTLKTKQVSLADEQIDAARGQTKNTLSNTGAIEGILGAQRLLYDQQRQSYIHDSMNKAAKLLADAWTTQKTVDDGWTPPSSFTNPVIDPAVLQYLQEVGVVTP